VITLAIDISLKNCGVVAYKHGANQRELGAVLTTDVIGYGISARATVRDRVRRIRATCDAILAHHNRWDPQFTVIEGPAYMAAGRQFDIGGLHYAVYAALVEQLQVEPEILSPMSARLKALGMGAPPKSFPAGAGRTKKWVAVRMGELIGPANVPKNEHIMDALVLALAKQGFSE
jgi:hypothetical protein